MPDVRIEKLESVTLGDFVKMVDRDKAGRFTYVGQVTEFKLGVKTKGKFVGALLTIITMTGKITFDMASPADHELFITDVKPPGWGKFMKDPTTFKSNNAPAAEFIEQPKSKRDLVFDIVKEHPKKRDKPLLKLCKLANINASESHILNYIQMAKLQLVKQ